VAGLCVYGQWPCRDQFELEFGHDWLTYLQHSDPDYAKVLVQDKAALPEAPRRAQLQQLHAVSEALHAAGVPLIYELFVPPTGPQRQAAGEDLEAFDRDSRPELVAQIIAGNHGAGAEPALWKVEGLESADAAQAVVTAARAGGRDNVAAIVLGRDAPPERLSHWLLVAAPIEGFVGFATPAQDSSTAALSLPTWEPCCVLEAGPGLWVEVPSGSTPECTSDARLACSSATLKAL
jgi:myo-inositol catabolism protein IolC